ncbi:Uu.00g007670.m01.CDS01 [Anthostomella pinea]|uniref:Uu.00g007670.m01.CDS01 n=1 Tax=Anthostomella pinea TaxID=933095 RepID=A0AAI8YPT1_9PEZI|nr:Uu.00g007670.m01.CDS01 [Anthostomella pinea]
MQLIQFALLALMETQKAESAGVQIDFSVALECLHQLSNDLLALSPGGMYVHSYDRVLGTEFTMLRSAIKSAPDSNWTSCEFDFQIAKVPASGPIFISSALIHDKIR